GLARSGTFLLASDTVSLRECFDREILPRNTWNKDILTASYAEIRRIEADGATIVCGHDAAQWETLKVGAEAYD
ncbi:MAG: N-acyl homoserine lactonase family protein, partial [Hyphomicrobiaceae bacterium]